MASIEPMEVGLVFWAETNAVATLQQLKSFGLRAGQLGIPPTYSLDGAAQDFKAALAGEDVVLTSAVCAYEGEDYSTVKLVHDTVGFTNAELRAPRIARTKAVSDFAAQLGIKALSNHIGFVPSDTSSPLYAELCDVARDICDHCAAHGQDFALETGQETAETLLAFLRDVDRSNLKVNFDPANLVMYGLGDPVAALKQLDTHVLSVHCKDGTPPVAGSGKLGSEVALGTGAVDFPAFLQQLRDMHYKGLLAIEREEPDAGQRADDIRLAMARLQEWQVNLG
jgi:L-ribulose-5-phosphate 3-epimerase